jgi:shikimate dehydrogenase
MDRYAVFGQPIGHSKSPMIHQLFAEQTGQSLEYGKQEVSAEAFDEAIEQFFSTGGKGLNCTVPLKELAWEKADKRSERAELSQAVNTLMLLDDGTLYGDNTDGVGLVRDLMVNNGITLKGQKILLLGAGGASKGILGPLLDQSPESIVVANRTVEKADRLAAAFKSKGNISSCGFNALAGNQFNLILNATAASLTGDLPPLPDNLLEPNGCCYDLAYDSEKTAFVLWGEAQGARLSIDGVGMLAEQAAEAFELWRGVKPETDAVIEQLEAART